MSTNTAADTEPGAAASDPDDTGADTADTDTDTGPGATDTATDTDPGATDTAAATVAALRQTFDRHATKPYRWRLAQLRALRAMLTERGNELEQALTADLGKSPVESQLTELGMVVAELDHAISHLRGWLRSRSVRVPGALLPAKGSVVREPLGVVLIIAPWNYAVQLLLAPLVGALAAGNAVVLKPSELAPATSACLARLVPKYLDTDAVAVVEGGRDETTALLAQRFDHIFYTGNGAVGRIVMQAAAKHLTPVTLELGGKSPAYVDETADLRVAARRIVWAKFMNAGQTCVAPDYLLATPAVASALERHLAEAVREMYGREPATNPDYGRIVNDEHFERLQAMLDEGRVVVGGSANAETRYIAPTVLADVSENSPLMTEEIFGPILPLLTVDSLDDAIRFIAARDKPLALYVFTESDRVKRRFLTETSSGAVGFGVPAAHLSVPGLPFGGVGESGMGAYHGERSMAVFSHEKAVLDKSLRLDTLKLIYPPFTPGKERFVRTLLRRLG